MQEIPSHLPGTYLTDGRRLLWVIERTSRDSVLVENVRNGEELEMGDADLLGYKVVTPENVDHDDK